MITYNFACNSSVFINFTLRLQKSEVLKIWHRPWLQIYKLLRFQKRGFKLSNHHFKNKINILGIETSCDDTGAAVVNESGKILGEGYYSQVKTSVQFGGVLPTVARKYHEKFIDCAVAEAFQESNLSPEDVTAVAATVKPGNTHTLEVGANFGKSFALKYKVPFIPIHHMEAHALTARMQNQIDFPFLTLLVSGGHCVLALAAAIDEWVIVGETSDMAPGCAIDQMARRLRLRNLPGMGTLCGGRAVEEMATKGDSSRFPFPSPMSKHRDANFSFSSFFTHAQRLIEKLEKENGIEGGRVLAEASDICASFQLALVKHLVRRTHRGMRFLKVTNRIPEKDNSMVISGGVASNSFLRSSFEKLCEVEGFRLLVPPPKLCTDNGVMVAWNGVERWLAGKGILVTKQQIEDVIVQHKCPLGPNISSEHLHLSLTNPKWVKL